MRVAEAQAFGCQRECHPDQRIPSKGLVFISLVSSVTLQNQRSSVLTFPLSSGVWAWVGFGAAWAIGRSVIVDLVDGVRL